MILMCESCKPTYYEWGGNAEGPYYYRFHDPDSIESTRIACERFNIIKRTRRGVWIGVNYNSRKRFVLDGDGRRYAYPTKELALHSYVQRKKAQIRHAIISKEFAESCLNMVKDITL